MNRVKRLMVVFVSLLSFVGCFSIESGESKDEDRLTGHPLKARIMGDLQERDLDRERPKDLRAIAELREGKWFCRADDEEMERVILLEEEKDRPNRRREEAYYCPKEKVYWFHRTRGAEQFGEVRGPFHLP